MSIGKKEVKLLIVLGLLVYGLLFYMIFVNNYIPEINDVNSKLAEAKDKEDALKKDLANIEVKKSELQTKKVISERMGNYLLESGDITDCIEYMQKLERLMSNKLTDIKIMPPVKVSSSSEKNDSGKIDVGAQTGAEPTEETSTTTTTNSNSVNGYYEMSIDFKADLAYNEIWELLAFIEGGSRRVKVSKFTMDTPKKEEVKVVTNAPKATPAPTPLPGQTFNGIVPSGQIYGVNATIKLYVLNIDDANKLFNFSRYKFNRFNEGADLKYTVSSITGDGYVPKVNNTTTTTNNNSVPQSSATGVADFTLDLDGYLKAGENFIIRGTNKDNEIFMNKTSGRTDVLLTINDSKYNMNIGYLTGKSATLYGEVPNRDLTADLLSQVPDIKENQKIKVYLKIVNNSSHKFKISIRDSNSRIKVMDRNGAVIKGSNNKEKVTIN